MQNIKSLDSIFASAIARVQAGNHHSQQPNNVRPTKPPKQRTTNNLSLTVSKALFEQLDRYCTDNDMPRSKVIRRAVYEMMRNTKHSAPRLPKFTPAPKRTMPIGWSLSRDREELDAVCADMNMTASEFQRRAIYLYTKAYVSTDATEAREAAADGWGTPNA